MTDCITIGQIGTVNFQFESQLSTTDPTFIQLKLCEVLMQFFVLLFQVLEYQQQEITQNC